MFRFFLLVSWLQFWNQKFPKRTSVAIRHWRMSFCVKSCCCIDLTCSFLCRWHEQLVCDTSGSSEGVIGVIHRLHLKWSIFKRWGRSWPKKVPSTLGQKYSINLANKQRNKPKALSEEKVTYSQFIIQTQYHTLQILEAKYESKIPIRVQNHHSTHWNWGTKFGIRSKRLEEIFVISECHLK